MNIPNPGYYYHYKHDPKGLLEKYAYRILGIGYHTEMQMEGEEGKHIVYKPLYKTSLAYEKNKGFWIRPLKMFIEPVDKPEYKGPRFIPITDEKVIEELKKIEQEMYGA